MRKGRGVAAKAMLLGQSRQAVRSKLSDNTETLTLKRGACMTVIAHSAAARPKLDLRRTPLLATQLRGADLVQRNHDKGHVCGQLTRGVRT